MPTQLLTGAALAWPLVVAPLTAHAGMPRAAALPSPPPPPLEAPSDEGEKLDREASAAGADPAALIDLSKRAESAGEHDRALWFAKLAIGAAPDDRAAKAARTRWIEARKATAAPADDPIDLLNEFARSLFDIAKSCESRSLYANAADVLNLLSGTSYEDEARGKLAKIFGKPKAIELLLASGVPVEVERREKLSKATIARIDAEHSDWSNPYEAVGPNYTIRTDMGYEMAHQMLDAMEQIHRFYRVVFDVKPKTGSCVVNVYKDRAEFDEYAKPGSDGVQGYYRPGENCVHTYDHGTVDWLGREFLWATLFHEASHQFTAAIWKLLIPTWLNEGTGSYFEGAELLPGGFVGVNRIPDSRLRNLVRMIGPGAKAGESGTGEQASGPSLKSVLSYFAPGSYPGEYYPFGWGLVYFCRNYEDADSRRVYLPIYQDFMRSWTKGAGNVSAFDRFVEYFITDAKVPGIDSFEAFEQTWKGWIRDLNKIHTGGREQADVLVARGRKQMADCAKGTKGADQYAADSFRWATDKNPLHATAWLELARASDAIGNKDAALYAYRRLGALAQRAVKADAPLAHFEGTAESALAASLAGIKGLDASIERTLREKMGVIVGRALAAADAHVEAGLPRTALSLLRDADLLLDGSGELRERIHDLAVKHEVDGRLFRSVPVDAELSAWTTEDAEWRAGADGAIEIEGNRGLATLRLAELPPKVYRFELTAVHSGAMIGILFDGQVIDEMYFLVQPSGGSSVMRYDSDIERAIARQSPFEPIRDFEGTKRIKKGEPFTIAIDVEHSGVRFLVDGEVVGTLDMPCEELTGQIGIVMQGKQAKITDVKLAY